MSSLQEVVDQIKSEISIDGDGKGTASVRATARLCGVEHTSIIRSGVIANPELAEKLAIAGFDGGVLVRQGVPDIAVAIFLEYFALDAGRYCTDQAKAAYRFFATVGIRKTFQRWMDWEEPVSPPPFIPSPDHIAAYNFDRSQFQPWKDSNPIASEIFLTWQNVAPAIAPAPVRVDTNFVLPSKEMQSALGDAFLNLNRSGLAMNKLFHFVDRIPTMQKMDSKAFTEMQEALLDAGETIHRLQDGLKDEKSKVAATSRTLKRLEGTIAYLEQQLVNVCQRTTSSPIVPDDVEPVPKGDRQKQLKSAKAK